MNEPMVEVSEVKQSTGEKYPGSETVVSLSQFITDATDPDAFYAEDHLEKLELIKALKVGEHVICGDGGASALFRVERVS